MIFDNAGNLYGTTYQGGLGIMLSRLRHGLRVEAFGIRLDGEHPLQFSERRRRKPSLDAGLIFDPSVNLYGATGYGGTGGGGTVFELSPPGDWTTLTVLYSFTSNSGYSCGPTDTLFRDTSGNLYGNTACDVVFGNVWELIYPNWTYKDLHDFTGTNDGGGPAGNVVIDSSGNLYGTAGGGYHDCGGGEPAVSSGRSRRRAVVNCLLHFRGAREKQVPRLLAPLVAPSKITP